ncbi:Dual specificity protein phosphatase 23, partial [Pseudolycoriella hygida]
PLKYEKQNVAGRPHSNLCSHVHRKRLLIVIWLLIGITMALTKYFVILFLVYLNFDISPVNAAAIPQRFDSTDSPDDITDPTVDSTTGATEDDIEKIFETYENTYMKNPNWFHDDEPMKNRNGTDNISDETNVETSTDKESTPREVETTEPTADDVVESIHSILDEKVDSKKNRTDRTIVVVVTTNVFHINGSDDSSKRQHTLLSFGTPGMLVKETSTDSTLAMYNQITTDFLNGNPSSTHKQSNGNEKSFSNDSDAIDETEVPEETTENEDLITTEKPNEEGRSSNLNEMFEKMDIRKFPDDKFTPTESISLNDTSANDTNDILRILKILPGRNDDDNNVMGTLTEPFEISVQESQDSSLMEAMENILDTDVRKAFERDIPLTRHVPLDINIEEEALFAPLKDLSEYVVEEIPINVEDLKENFQTNYSKYIEENVEPLDIFGRGGVNDSDLEATTATEESVTVSEEHPTELPTTKNTKKGDVTTASTEDLTTEPSYFTDMEIEEIITTSGPNYDSDDEYRNLLPLDLRDEHMIPITEIRREMHETDDVIEETSERSEDIDISEVFKSSDVSEQDEVPKMEHVLDTEERGETLTNVEVNHGTLEEDVVPKVEQVLDATERVETLVNAEINENIREMRETEDDIEETSERLEDMSEAHKSSDVSVQNEVTKIEKVLDNEERDETLTNVELNHDAAKEGVAPKVEQVLDATERVETLMNAEINEIIREMRETEETLERLDHEKSESFENSGVSEHDEVPKIEQVLDTEKRDETLTNVKVNDDTSEENVVPKVEPVLDTTERVETLMNAEINENTREIPETDDVIKETSERLEPFENSEVFKSSDVSEQDQVPKIEQVSNTEEHDETLTNLNGNGDVTEEDEVQKVEQVLDATERVETLTNVKINENTIEARETDDAIEETSERLEDFEKSEAFESSDVSEQDQVPKIEKVLDTKHRDDVHANVEIIDETSGRIEIPKEQVLDTEERDDTLTKVEVNGDITNHPLNEKLVHLEDPFYNRIFANAENQLATELPKPVFVNIETTTDSSVHPTTESLDVTDSDDYSTIQPREDDALKIQLRLGVDNFWKNIIADSKLFSHPNDLTTATFNKVISSSTKLFSHLNDLTTVIFNKEISTSTVKPAKEDVVSEVVKVDEETTEQHQVIKKPGVALNKVIELKPIHLTNVEANDLPTERTVRYESRSLSENDEPVDPLRTLVEGVELTAEVTKTIDNFRGLSDKNDPIHYAANQIVEIKDTMELGKNEYENVIQQSHTDHPHLINRELELSMDNIGKPCCIKDSASNDLTTNIGGTIEFNRGCVMYTNANIKEIVKKYIHCVPEHCQSNRQKRDGLEYHVTVINKIESKTIDERRFTDCILRCKKSGEFNLIEMGLGSLKSPDNDNNKTYFLLVHSPELDQVRKELNLESIDFHITLGFDQKDVHEEGKKSLRTIQQKNVTFSVESLLTHPSPYKAKQIQYLEWIVKNYPTDLSIKKVIKELIKLYPKSKYNKIKELVEVLIDMNDLDGFYVQTKVDLAMALPPSEIFNNLSTLFDREFDSETIDPKSLKFLLDFLNNNINNQTIKKQHFYEFDDRKFVTHELPFNFSWVQPNLLGGSSIPSLSDLKLFAKMGIVHVITCLEQPLSLVQDYVKIHFFPIDDRTPPTMTQLDEMLNIVQLGEPTVVHCKGGVGRTNTVLACILIKQQKLNTEQAIAQIKALRPKVILDDKQIKFIREFSNLQHACHKPKIKLPKLILFVGYPASGKSTLSTHFVKYFGDEHVVRINQDESGRKATTEQFNQNIKNSKTILVDNCNLTKEKRKVWIDLAFNTNQAWCIYFDFNIEELKQRIVRRVNHPTVKNGLKILATLKDQLEEPEYAEGFSKIIKIENEDDVDSLLNDLGITEPIDLPPESRSQIVKFVRTRHLTNLGAASRDDLLLTAGEQDSFLKFPLDVEEKIDGANLGIVVKSDYKISVQNRSHYVSSSYHAQFSLLDNWILKHTDELINLLEPEEEILYGEWCYMKHSIHYTRLPDLFLAFDIFNCLTQEFLSRRELGKRLEGTSIKQVPLIVSKKFSNLKELVDVATKTKSSYYDGLIEGFCEIVQQRVLQWNMESNDEKTKENL